jgi:general L-amino acid transport system permease protein
MTGRAALLWCRRNLFATSLDTALSCVFLPLTVLAAWQLGAWALLQARWSIIGDNLRVLMVGTFPPQDMARAWDPAAALAVAAGPASTWRRGRKGPWPAPCARRWCLCGRCAWRARAWRWPPWVCSTGAAC